MVGSDELKSRLTTSHKLLSLFQGNSGRKHRRESCAEPNWWLGYGKRAESKSIWYGSFSLVQQKFDRVCRTFVELYLGSTHGTPSESDVAPVSLHSMASEPGLTDAHLRDGPLQNLWREGRAKYQKKYLRKGKLNEKNSCTPINPKKYLCYALKKIHTRNLITKKIPAARKFPTPPPHNFSNGPSLNQNYVFHFLLMTKLPVREGNAW